jgi:hypothetical protein
VVTTCPLPTKTTAIKQQNTSSLKNLLAHSAKLGWILVNKKTISQSQLESVLNRQLRENKKLGELLLEQHLISDEELQLALKEQYWRRNGYWVI